MPTVPLGGEDFVKAAADHGHFTTSGDSRSCNNAYDKIVSVVNHLKRSPDSGEAILIKLLSYPDESVKSWAAAYLLPTHPEIATKALEEIASQPGIIAFNAAMTLKEWLAGRLKLL